MMSVYVWVPVRLPEFSKLFICPLYPDLVASCVPVCYAWECLECQECEECPGRVFTAASDREFIADWVGGGGG